MPLLIVWVFLFVVMKIINTRDPVPAYALQRHCYIWWPYAIMSNCPLADPLLPLRYL